MGEAFTLKYGDGKAMDQAERLNKWNDVAKELIDTTWKDSKGALQDRAREANNCELKEWELGLKEIGQAEDVHL